MVSYQVQVATNRKVGIGKIGMRLITQGGAPDVTL